MAFNATWFLLEQEGLLSQSCLCNGLTALRHANLGDKKGLFYSAFFELWNGLERMLKLVLILDHMARNQLAPPDSKSIEDYGHNLHDLFNATKTICADHSVTFLDSFQPNSLPFIILKFLDDFAHPGGRYSNINKLTGHKLQSMADPIAKWGEIVDRIMCEHAAPRERQRAALHGKAASLIRDMDQRSLDCACLFTRTSQLDSAARHAIFALVTLIASLREVIDLLRSSALTVNPPGNSGLVDVPDMAVFFEFAWANRRYVMRKRRWP